MMVINETVIPSEIICNADIRIFMEIFDIVQRMPENSEVGNRLFLLNHTNVPLLLNEKGSSFNSFVAIAIIFSNH